VSRILRKFALVWGLIAVATIIGGLAWLWAEHGFSAARERLNPMNPLNLPAVILICLPSHLAMSLADRLEGKPPSFDRKRRKT
jgi:hypothetical protein